MPYDQLLAARVRRALESRADMVEKAIVRGLGVYGLGKHVLRSESRRLIIRLERRTTAEQLNSPHVRPWDFMPSRPMLGMFAVSGQGSADQGVVDKWVKLALKHATSLPAKIKGSKSRGASGAKPSTSRVKERK
jgi:hypothetical protein